MNKPLIALTAGDPAGIGPEIIASLWTRPQLHEQCRPVVFGPPVAMRRACELVGSFARVVEASSPEDVAGDSLTMPVIPCGPDDAGEIAPGQLDRRGGQSAYEALAAACEMALAGRVNGITTAPLNKAALALAGFEFPGHTELLAHLCGVREVAMMLYLPPTQDDGSAASYGGPAGLGVVHATLHTALSRVFSELTPAGIASKVKLADAVFRCLLNNDDTPPTRLRIPRIGVCALNPHAGENGLFGDEERRIIQPAVEQARQQGYRPVGPLPADTLLARAAAGEFDAVVAMYHDQGHVALKMLGMSRAVNITLGLPIVRTSVAHGTAFDRAWQGTADPGSLWHATQVAIQLVRRRADLRWTSAITV